MTVRAQNENGAETRRAFYGRRKGPALRTHQAGLIEHVLPKLILDPTADRPDHIGTLFAQPIAGAWLEIGFGGGEHLAAHRVLRPEFGFIGVEPFINGMAKFLAASESAEAGESRSERRQAPVRLYNDDATPLLDWLPDGCLDGIDLLYPDPWHKKRHWKRRFVNPANLNRFARLLKPGGVFRFASDIESYVNWTLHHLQDHDGFSWTAQGAPDWREPWHGWVRTRYEAKAIREGRTPCYLTFRRNP
ncbi:MAG: tRNA (guanine(46)-N(7))-methyltransferase TrmB [Pseudomonadota bacterium]